MQVGGNSGGVEPPLKKFRHLSNIISHKKREAKAIIDVTSASAIIAAEAEVEKLRHNIYTSTLQ